MEVAEESQLHGEGDMHVVSQFTEKDKTSAMRLYIETCKFRYDATSNISCFQCFWLPFSVFIFVPINHSVAFISRLSTRSSTKQAALVKGTEKTSK